MIDWCRAIDKVLPSGLLFDLLLTRKELQASGIVHTLDVSSDAENSLDPNYNLWLTLQAQLDLQLQPVTPTREPNPAPPPPPVGSIDASSTESVERTTTRNSASDDYVMVQNKSAIESAVNRALDGEPHWNLGENSALRCNIVSEETIKFFPMIDYMYVCRWKWFSFIWLSRPFTSSLRLFEMTWWRA